jgi:hypothetical protein
MTDNEIKIALLEESSKVFFDERAHKYSVGKKTGFDSVTGIISEILEEEKFDSIMISKKVSRMENSEYFDIEPRIIRKIWEQTALNGNFKHKQIEDHFNNNKQIKDCEVEFFKKLNFYNQIIINEYRLFSEEMMIAGTADIITIENGNIYVYDIKTSKKIDIAKMRKFRIQILIYSYLIKETLRRIGIEDVKVIPRGIVHIEPMVNISKLSFDVNDAEFKKPHYINISPEKFLKYKDDIRKMKSKLNERKQKFEMEF